MNRSAVKRLFNCRRKTAEKAPGIAVEGVGKRRLRAVFDQEVLHGERDQRHQYRAEKSDPHSRDGSPAIDAKAAGDRPERHGQAPNHGVHGDASDMLLGGKNFRDQIHRGGQ